MIVRVATTERADADIRDIAAYIALDNEEAAREFGTELWACFQRLTENPDIGHGIPDFGSLRVLRVSKRFWRYLVFYRRAGSETIEIVRVLHGARDLTALLRDLV